MIREFDEKIKRGEKLTEKERLLDVERQYREKAMCRYPNSLGVTGQVFQTG